MNFKHNHKLHENHGLNLTGVQKTWGPAHTPSPKHPCYIRHIFFANSLMWNRRSGCARCSHQKPSDFFVKVRIDSVILRFLIIFVSQFSCIATERKSGRNWPQNKPTFYRNFSKNSSCALVVLNTIIKYRYDNTEIIMTTAY